MFADFVRHSRSLQHLDVSGMGFSERSLEQFCLDGIKRSKTLLAIHMGGNLGNQDLLAKVRKWLRVLPLDGEEDHADVEKPARTKLDEELLGGTASISKGFQNHRIEVVSKIHKYRDRPHAIAKGALREEYKIFLMQADIEKYTNSNNYRLEEILRTNRFQPVKSDRIVFQRFLGHYEILNGFRW